MFPSLSLTHTLSPPLFAHRTEKNEVVGFILPCHCVLMALCVAACDRNGRQPVSWATCHKRYCARKGMNTCGSAEELSGQHRRRHTHTHTHTHTHKHTHTHTASDTHKHTTHTHLQTHTNTKHCILSQEHAASVGSSSSSSTPAWRSCCGTAGCALGGGATFGSRLARGTPARHRQQAPGTGYQVGG